MRRAVLCAAGLVLAAAAEGAAAEHPFILWTKEEAAAIRKRLDADPLAREQLARTIQMSTAARGGHPTLLNLFKYMVLGDADAGEAERRALRGFMNRVPEPMTEAFKEASKGRKWTRGGPSFSDRHMRDEQTLHTMRYDVLYPVLSAEERRGVENSFRAYIQFHLSGHRPWHPDFHYDRMSWLPNMHWPRTIGTHLMAAALRDESLIEAMFRSTGGWKFFFDEYLCDGRFYSEEFGKYYSNIGTMLLWCEALERLGLGKYGYGYTGKGGATMERFLRMPFDLGYPRIDIPGGMPAYTIVQMGDTPGSLHAMNGLGDGDAIVTGYLPDGQTGGLSWFGGGRMNGPLPKFMAPMWWELGHRRSPQAGFDYFLAQMRQPGQDLYLPSLYWGLGPIDPKQVRPPAPATSYVAMERGFAFLRADETAAYWEGPGPAVALQFGMYYVHYAHDGFSILGYHALNRTLYTHAWGGQGGTVNESIKAHPRGYIGGHPWHDTVRGYAGVVVDNLKALPIAGGDHGLQHHRLRQDFAPAVKFVAGRVKPTEVTDSRWVFNEEKDEMETVSEKTVRGLYPGVDLERALFLTDEYLLDVFWLSSDRPRRYDWAVHGAGSHRLDAARGWAPTSELNGSMLYRDAGEAQPEGYADQRDGNDLLDVHKMDPGDAAWTGVIVQDGPHGDPKRCRLPPEWFARGVGVRVSMLGEAGTTVFAGRPPQGTGGPVADALRDYAALGGATLLVRRTVPATAFVALHEPFEGGEAKAPATALERIGQDAGGVAVRILGKAGALNDRACLRYGEEVEGPLTLSGGGERFTFADHAFVRIGRDTVEAVGDLRAMKLKVEGRPRLRLNGKDVPARVAGGYLEYGP